MNVLPISPAAVSSLPAPPVPLEADLQDFSFMPLQVARLRDSDFNVKVSDAEFRCALTLWCAAWHQLPAGSLPDDDATLAHLAGLGRDLRTWRKVRSGSLYGFEKCSDGRLYHKIIAEQVIEAWTSKLKQRHRVFCAAIRKHNERHPAEKLESPDFEAWLSQGRPSNVTRDMGQLSRVTPPEKACDIDSKGQGQGQGQGQSKEELPEGSLSSGDADDRSSSDDFELELQGAEAASGEQPVTVDELVGDWNELAEELGLPRVEKITPSRRQAARARIREFPNPASWQRAFAKIRGSPHCRGENDRGWKANFDFLMRPSKLIAVIEGQYDGKA